MDPQRCLMGGHHAGSSSTSWCNVGEKPNPTGLALRPVAIDAFSNASLKIALKQIFGAEKKTKSKRFFNMLNLEPTGTEKPNGMVTSSGKTCRPDKSSQGALRWKLFKHRTGCTVDFCYLSRYTFVKQFNGFANASTSRIRNAQDCNIVSLKYCYAMSYT